MSHIESISTEDLLDRTIAGWEACGERMRRLEKTLNDLLRRMDDIESVFLEQMGSDDRSEISCVSGSTIRGYCRSIEKPPR